MAGFRLRGYSIERLLGRGASSEVWRARVSATGEPVALKRLLRTDADQLARAHAEAALLTVLDHPNLVRLHSVVPTPEAAVLVLDLADGGSLADLLARRGRLTPAEVITAIAPAAAALAYVHRQGVVHGDVSAANLLFTPNGTALLADLGVARLTGDMSDAESTPAYVDPAVADGSPPATASDVFMLAAVALHALTGEPIWPGRRADELLAAARIGDVSTVPARLAAARVPEQMAAVVVRALAAEPRRRGTAADLALDLRSSGTPVAVELAAGRRPIRPAAAAPASEISAPDAGAPEPPKRRVVYDPRHAAPVGGPSGPGGLAAAVTSVRRVPPSALGSLGVPVVSSWRVASDADPPGVDTPDVEDTAGPAAPPALPPTSAVRRPRPVIPRPPRRRVPRRLAVLAVLAGIAVLAVAAAALVAVRVGTGASRHDPSRRTVAASTDWLAALRSVDRLRARAFATGNPALLSRVYASGRLRTADTVLLRRLVPATCSLRGVTTRFTDVRITPGQHRASITGRAGVAASTLHCPRRPDRPVAPVAAAPVRIELVATPEGVRITDLRAD